MEKCEITAENAQRASDLQKLDATEYKPTVAEAMEVEQLPHEHLTEDQKNLQKPTRLSELYESWQRTPLPNVGAQQRLS